MKFLLVLLTWFGTITPMTQEIEMRDERKCEAMKARIEADWASAPKEFVGIIVCQVK